MEDELAVKCGTAQRGPHDNAATSHFTLQCGSEKEKKKPLCVSVCVCALADGWPRCTMGSLMSPSLAKVKMTFKPRLLGFCLFLTKRSSVSLYIVRYIYRGTVAWKLRNTDDQLTAEVSGSAS